MFKKLLLIQQKLKAPKNQFNKFGNYAYRSCEDILEALKPLLAETNTALVIQDEITEVNGRVYVKSTVTLHDCDGLIGVESVKSVSSTALAREPLDQKGMNEAQITGSASSYARKYALNGLFLIDDNKDADCTNTHEKVTSQVAVNVAVDAWKVKLNACKSLGGLQTAWVTIPASTQANKELVDLKEQLKAKLSESK